jgi:hypothetical protein
MATGSKITELTLLSSGSISPSGSLMEIVQGGVNYGTTPDDIIGSIFSSKSVLNNLTQSVIDDSHTHDNKAVLDNLTQDIIDNSPTSDEKAAMSGSSGTPGSGNVYVTDSDPRLDRATLRNFTLSEDMVTEDLAVLKSDGQIRKIIFSTFGNKYIYNEDSTSEGEITVLDTTKFVISYRDINTSSRVAIAGNINGSILTFGSKSVYASASAAIPCRIKVLNSSKFITCYQESAGGPGIARIGSVSGTSITFGSASVFNSASSPRINLACIDDTKFIISYRDVGNSSYGTARIGSVSGTSITFGSASVFNSAATSPCQIGILDNTTFVVTYRKDTDNFNAGAKVGIISDLTITSFGTEVEYDTATNTIAYWDGVASLNNSTFVVTYAKNGLADRGTVRVGKIVGTSISFGSEYNYSTTSAGGSNTFPNPGIAPLTDSKFVVTYAGSKTCVGTIVGTTVSFDTENTFDTTSSYMNVQNIDTVNYIVTYVGTSNYGTAIFGVSDPTLITDKILGILQASGSMGESKPVAIFGDISEIHSGLIPGNFYYYDVANKNGVTLTNNTYLAGIALSTTELKIVSY